MRTACGCGGVRQLIRWDFGFPPPQRQRTQCCICLEMCELSGGLRCSNNHFVCDSCLTQYVASQSTLAASGMRSDIKTPAVIYCPCRGRAAGNCTSAPFSDSQIAGHAEAYALQLYYAAKENSKQPQLVAVDDNFRMQDGARKSTVLSRWQVVSDAMSRRFKDQCLEANRQVLSDQLRLRLPNAVQCSRCSFGPIDFWGCSDLSAHHQQAVRCGATVLNSCPRCGWFARSINAWPRWNGHVPDTAVQDNIIQGIVGLRMVYARELRAALCGLILGIYWATRGLFWAMVLRCGEIWSGLWATILLALASSAEILTLMAKSLAPLIIEGCIVVSLSVTSLQMGRCLFQSKSIRSQRKSCIAHGTRSGSMRVPGFRAAYVGGCQHMHMPSQA